jgi:hypothetical protein
VDDGAVPAEARGCTFGASDGNVHTCIFIDGPDQSRFVDEIDGSAEVLDSTRTLQVCIHGPASASLEPHCSPFQVVHPGDSPLHTEPWFPNRVMPAGTYCARTWRKNNDGSSPTLIGEACVDVHS